MKPSDLSKVIEELKKGIVVRATDENLEELGNHTLLELAEQTGDEEVLSLVANTLTVLHDELAQCHTTLQNKLSALESNLGESEPIKGEDLEEVVAMAEEFDNSEDPGLQKLASVLDQLLLTISAPKGAKEAFALAQEAEIEKLREKYRTQALENSYKKPSEKLDEKIKEADVVKSIKDSVKQFRPLEAPLSTRTCPEHPGSPLQRVGDYVYQCTLDKKIYDFKAGYTSLKGNQVPGGDVSLQTQSLGDRAPDHMAFDTRESRLNS